jgi:hypothetical protein
MSADRNLSAAICLVLTSVITFHCTMVHAEGGEQPPAQYVSLPGNKPLRDEPQTAGAPDIRGMLVIRPGAPVSCLPGSLRLVVADVAARFGAVSVESTHRTRGHNGRAGGARHSLHLSCRAVDFRVRSRGRGVMAYLRSRPEVGGLKMYRTGIIHIDNGERRTW